MWSVIVWWWYCPPVVEAQYELTKDVGMREELDAKLVADYPELYRDRNAPMNQTAMCWGFDCGDGWYQLIDALSFTLTADHRRAKDSLEYYRNNFGKELWKGKIVTQEDIDKAQKELDENPCPVAVQVKEKFGGLRFYVDRATEKQYNYINFTEMLSYRTCEECGAPGRTYTMGWHRTLCEKHADEHYGEEAAHYRNKTADWADEEEKT